MCCLQQAEQDESPKLSEAAVSGASGELFSLRSKGSSITAWNRGGDILPSLHLQVPFLLLCVSCHRILKKGVGSYTAVGLHSGNIPVSLWEILRVSGELRKGKGNQTIAGIPSLKSDVSVL